MFFRRIFFIVFICFAGTFQACYAQNYNSTNTEVIMPNKLIQPPYLKPGDTIAIVAPSGILNNRTDEIAQAEALLKSWRLNVVIGDHVFARAGHFAGSDEQRTNDLQKAIDDKSIKAIWCARGGYGTVRVIDQLDYSALKENPKWIIGYSDITALHNDLNNEGIESIHALMCTSLTEDLSEIETSVTTFKNALFGTPLNYEIKGSKYNKIGRATGQLVGGNLTLLHTMLGSRTSIDTDNKIIFFEEIGEYAYHIDRMLISMKRAGYFENCNGIIVGDISKVRKNTTPWGKPVKQLILDVFEEYDFPIMFDFPAGHEKDNRALILGRTINIAVSKDNASISYPE
ncbi:MAG: LD-carboxypeptidase [Flavobacteriaceae bacterium]|nr:LD-carboxypeptidase [Flavobacteriaceae bacterium]